jgi:hypothetical protein
LEPETFWHGKLAMMITTFSSLLVIHKPNASEIYLLWFWDHQRPWRMLHYRLHYSIISKALSRFNLFKPIKLVGHNNERFELQNAIFFNIRVSLGLHFTREK